MAALGFDALIDEVNDRGFNHLSDTRLGRYVNQEYYEICAADRWPFLYTTETGAPPKTTTATIHAVDSVIDTTNKKRLQYLSRSNLLDIDTDLTTTGNPVYWYISEATTDTTIVNVYPANTGVSLSINFYKQPTILSGTNAHILPIRFENLIVDGACIRAYKDSDDFDSAAALQQFYDQDLMAMRQEFIRNWDNTEYVVNTQTYDAGGLS